MENQRLRHDVAFAAATAIVEIFQNLLMPDEVKDAREEVYRAVMGSLEYYDQHRERMEKRLRPMSN